MSTELTDLFAKVQKPYPMLFVTVSGAHLYGFPSPDSDVDFRGVHILPLKEITGLDSPKETLEESSILDNVEIDLVTHDAKKFFRLMLNRNGYVLEQLYSPIVIHSSPEFEELKQIAPGCITRRHANHYLGFAQNQWNLLQKESNWKAKTLLYLFRVILTGIHLMQTGRIQANLLALNEQAKLPYIDELVEIKTKGKEKSAIVSLDKNHYEKEYHRLMGDLEVAKEQSSLPDTPSAKDALNDLLLRIRLTNK